jgi:predicted O-methyltransferase YrrM
MALADRRLWLKQHNIDLLQFGDELDQLDAYMRKQMYNLTTMVEIGVWQGGSLYALTDYLKAGATIIGVDPGATAVNSNKAMFIVQTLVTQGFDAHMVYTRSVAAKLKVLNLLSVHHKPPLIDYLHIDGSHKYEDIRADFATYAPLVRPGGIIQLHDVVNVEPKTGRLYGTAKFWRELLKLGRYPQHVVFTNTQAGRVPGIGLLTA